MKHALLKIFDLHLSKRVEIPDDEPRFYFLSDPNMKSLKKFKFEWTGKYQNDERIYPIYEFVDVE